MKAKILNLLLLITFVLTMMVPLTGITIHKIASVLFLLLCLVHTVMYRKKLNSKRYLILGIIVFCFVSGIAGMMFYNVPIIMTLHRAVSIASIFFLAIHIFVYQRKLKFS